MPNRILIVGDLILDRTWLVSKTPTASTSQSHGDVRPLRSPFPEKRTDIIGGAGGVARAICAMDKDAEVDLFGEWPNDFDPIATIPETDFRRRIKAHRCGWTDFITEKLRIYVEKPFSSGFERRFDRDLTKLARRGPLDVQWPRKEDISAVVVMDYGKGFVDQVLAKLNEYRGVHFILRSKRNMNDNIFQLPWTVLLPNRDDLGRLVGYELPPSQQFIRIIGDDLALHPDLVRWLQQVNTAHPDKCVFVKLDREGGVLLFRDKHVVTFSLAPQSQGNWAGIAAGSMFTGALTYGLSSINSSALDLTNMTQICERAVKQATAFCKANDTVDKEEWLGISFIFKPWPVSLQPKDTAKDMGKLDDLSQQVKVASDCSLMLLNGCIFLRNANWYLDGFLTVNPDLGNDILRLKSEIRSYFYGDSRQKRPYLVAVCGNPGAGKSHLADRLKEELKCEIVPTNAAQWTSIDDLFMFCERIRNVQVRKGNPLGFIDEVDSQLLSEHLYGKLLAPVGDSLYVLKGEERRLGRAAFLLAGSRKPWDDADLLRRSAEPREDPKVALKLPDLVSRMSFVLQLPSLSKPDIMYITAYAFLKEFQSIRYIHEGVFRLFCDSALRHGPRSINWLVEGFVPLADPTIVTTNDFRYDESELELHLEKVPRDWKTENKKIEIRF
jgi:hypothetical protein